MVPGYKNGSAGERMACPWGGKETQRALLKCLSLPCSWAEEGERRSIAHGWHRLASLRGSSSVWSVWCGLSFERLEREVQKLVGGADNVKLLDCPGFIQFLALAITYCVYCGKLFCLNSVFCFVCLFVF